MLRSSGSPEYDWRLVLIFNAAFLGPVCFWWPLVRRRPVPAHTALRIAAYAVGFLYVLCILRILGTGVISLKSEVTVFNAVLYGPTLAVHAAAVCWFLTRPRLLLSWVLGVLLTPVVFAVVYMLWIPARGRGEAIIFYVGALLWCGPVAAPLFGLPLAWWWVWHAERAKARKKPMTTLEQLKANRG
jgi:hypothetical protein